MRSPLSFEEWYNKFEEELSNDCYIAYMESGAYLYSDREKFEEGFISFSYEAYLQNCSENEADYY